MVTKITLDLPRICAYERNPPKYSPGFDRAVLDAKELSKKLPRIIEIMETIEANPEQPVANILNPEELKSVKHYTKKKRSWYIPHLWIHEEDQQ